MLNYHMQIASSPLCSASYIPSPLGSPSAARRSVQRLGDRICASPILSRVRRRINSTGGGGGGGSGGSGGGIAFVNGEDFGERRGLCGLLSGLTGGGGGGSKGGGGGGGDWDVHGTTNVYLWTGGDTGRIANRHQDDRWDVW